MEEKSHFGQPDFRVRGKIFAGLDREGAQGTLKLSPELQAMLLSSRPEAFSPAAGYWGRQGWTRVHLEAVELGALKELVLEAFRMIAPKRLVSAKPQAARTRASKAETPRAAAGKKRSRGVAQKR